MQNRFTATVRDMSGQGMGVVDHPDGLVFFARGVWPGDVGEFEVEQVEKRYGFARLIELHQASVDREAARCPHLGLEPGQCGGCQWMTLNYEKQLFYKQKSVVYSLMRTGALKSEAEVKPIFASPQVYGYRNRAQLKTDGLQVGYVSTGSKVLAPIKNCVVLSEKNQNHLQWIHQQLPNAQWRPTGDYLWSYIDIDEWMSSEEIQVNTRRPFRQANNLQNEKMKNWIQKKLETESKETPILELFCGSGNFTEVLVRQGFLQITAVEAVAAAIEDLHKKNWPGVTPMVSNLFIPREWKTIVQQARGAEVLILDPPREGFRKIEDFLTRFKKLRRILYVSCDLNSFSTEARMIKKQGWTLKEVQPVDQFPHTPHVELMGEFVREFKPR